MSERRSLWTQEDLDRLQDGQHYPHEYGPPSGAPEGSDGPGAEQARRAVRDLGISKGETAKLRYDRNRRDYVSDEEVSGNQDAFVLEMPPVMVAIDALPASAKRTAKAALALGWKVRCWASWGLVAPVLFLNASEDGAADPHQEGDVRYDGYRLTAFTVEAINEHMGTLAFQAFYEGKEYQSHKKDIPGSFSWARVSDPAGLPVELSYDYPPIKIKRGTDEKGRVTEDPASFARRQRESDQMSERLKSEMNGGLRWVTIKSFHAAAGFDAWLKEWTEMENRNA